MTVLVFGAGTDYALLLVARYREELRLHEDRHEAMAVALHRAGPAIFASAGTVIVGMLCLTGRRDELDRGLGPVAAIGIAVGLLAMLTLLPALLVIFGRWVFWPMIPHYGLATSPRTTASGRGSVSASPCDRARIWVVTTVILGIACFGVIQLDATGLSNKEQYTETVPVGRPAKRSCPSTSRPAPPTRSRSWPTPTQADAVREAAQQVDGGRRTSAEPDVAGESPICRPR